MSPLDDSKKPPPSGAKSSPTYWRSLAELEGRPEFREFVEREFAEPLDAVPPDSPERRRFLQLMGASLALAGATGCRWEQEKLLPYSRRPAGVIDGDTRVFATSMELGGVGVGLHVTSYDNRPIKIDGNPAHPGSLGGTSHFHQASILDLYDPDRSTSPVRFAGGQRTPATWEEFEAFLKPILATARASGGAALRVLAGPSNSPTLADVKRRFLEAFPQARWVTYSPIADDNERLGSALAFGKPHRTHWSFEHASVVVSLDADFVLRHPNAVANAHGLMSRRNPDEPMNRVYAIESSFTLLGGIADHRLALRSELIKAVAAYLDAEISAKTNGGALGPAQARPNAAFLSDAKVTKFLDAVVKDLLKNVGQSVVVVGAQQPPEVHALGHRINALLGNVGRTVDYSPESEPDRPRTSEALQTLTTALGAGSVETLIILGENPVYDSPADLGFGDALAKVKYSLHLSLREDETSQKCSWHLPLTHFLESWGDTRAFDGTVGIAQPLIAPLFGGRSAIELMALVAGEPTPSGLELVKRTHAALLGDERRWRAAVHDGVVAATTFERNKPTMLALTAIPLSARELGGADVENGQLELVLVPDAKLWDGRYANNGWLVELPDPITKISWDNVALISPATAKKLGVADASLVKLAVGGKEITVPAVISPGQADGSIQVSLGWGRTDAGLVGGGGLAEVAPIGVNAYKLRTTALYYFGGGLQLAPTGEGYLLSGVQDRWAIDQGGTDGVNDRLHELIREAPLEEYEKEPGFAKHVVHHEPLLSLWYPPVSYEGHKWGMSIDLNKCTGCSSCIVACQAENNIPVVGKAAIERGREMYWLRIDRYFRGKPESPELVFQPVTCHQCENAPCEQVCPVGATMHSREGLNDMVYNRCIGTRYCSNNCPYKVRRFNFFNYREDLKDPHTLVRRMVYNPDVTMRSRGVMEKCTFCVQRIQKVKIRTKNARRDIKDGEIRTACQQACPTGAIVFGDLNDGVAKVKDLHFHPRSYAMLGELNNYPRLQYLARIRNPNPELA